MDLPALIIWHQEFMEGLASEALLAKQQEIAHALATLRDILEATVVVGCGITPCVPM